ncbi:methyltransferase domain-containing protein [Natronococcus wangiae]|uniref:methyltransferase domain-containing protein n=1 Tax=Natronococcus wangiae TaxID=3068275 RepID=UPI00387E9BF7
MAAGCGSADFESIPTGGSMPNRSIIERVRSLFDHAAPRYNAVVRTATIGMDILWKRRMIAMIANDRGYDRNLDLACGTGIVTFDLASRYPNAEVVGLDVSPNMLSVARDRNKYDNVRFVEKPAEEIGDFGQDSSISSRPRTSRSIPVSPYSPRIPQRFSPIVGLQFSTILPILAPDHMWQVSRHTGLFSSRYFRIFKGTERSRPSYGNLS